MTKLRAHNLALRGFVSALLIVLALATLAVTAEISGHGRARRDQIEQFLKTDVPRVLCLDSNFTTGGQPTDQAYAKAAASGFHSVLSLRTATEGVDLVRERSLVEKSDLRYFDIPVVSRAPRPEQADKFIRLVEEKSNHPMLINCASANRVGAFMMIYRVVKQGWSEDKALQEAIKIGLKSDMLKKFARDYIARHKTKQS